jgi:5S rRNA maturation endonuclease (ribonuclease M5)
MARLVMVIKHLTLQQAHDFVGTAPVPLLNIEALPQLPDWKNRARKDQYPTLSEAVLGPYRKFCAEYLLGRGFSKASLKFYEIGYDLQNCKIIIPVRDVRGKLVGITERLDFDHDKFQMSKYRHSEFQKALHLYGMQKWAGKEIDALYLVEGQLDVVRMYQLGKHAVAVMGDNLSAEQTDVLVRHAQVNRLVLAFDNDEAGQVVTLSAARRLHKTRFGPKLAVMEYDTKDPGELTDRSKTRVVSIHSTKLLMTPASNSVRLFHPHH